MNKPTIRKTKWFWPWQDDKEEAWLEQMSAQGLHLQRPARPTRYEFIQGQPQQYTYRLDFQDTMKTKSKEVYLRLFADLGWEHLGTLGGWQYFRRPVQPGEPQELFTDPETKILKYKRFLSWFGLAFPAYLVVFVALWSSWPEWMMWVNVAIILLLAVVWGIVEYRVTRRIKELQGI